MRAEQLQAGEGDVAEVPDLWTRVRNAEVRCLALDYDGTLAPFHVDRLQAKPLAGIIETIEMIRVSGKSRIAFVSGRPIDELLALVGPLSITMIGSHGFERREPHGAIQRHPLDSGQTRALDAALLYVQQTHSAYFAQGRTERKAGSVATHVRGMPGEEATSLLEDIGEAWRRSAEAAAMECRTFNGGLELRATGVDKGTALADWLATVPSGKRVRLDLYIGDDDTDEDAFALMRERGGIGIKVGDGATAAQGRLADCSAVRAFLSRWATLDKGAA